MIAPNRILWLPGDVETRSLDDDLSGRTAAGVRVNADTALRCTVVLGCLRVLAEGVAGLPLHLYRRRPDGGKEIAREHPLYHVLHVAPNDWQTSFEWREQQMLHLGLHGNAYNEIRAGKRGAVSALIPLHPSRMACERLENGRLRYTYREPNGSQTVYTQDQIMHLRWLSNDGVLGMVPIELARDAIALARACEIHGSSFFANGARPGFVLTTDNELDQQAAVALRDNWERMHRGSDRANRTAVLSGGLKPVELGGASNQESQFLESRRFQTEEICRIFRVPPHLVGDLTRSSFSNIEQQSLDFIQHTLLGWLRRFETAFTRDLITDDNIFAEFDTRGMLRGDASARASYYSTLASLGVASVNEIRGWENLNPVEGGDERFVQLNMQTLTNASKPQPDPQAAEQPTAEQPAQPTADVGGLLAILEQVGAGTVAPDAAVSIIGSVFPAMPRTTATAIVAGVTPAQPHPGAPGEPPGAAPEGPTNDPGPGPGGPPGEPQAPQSPPAARAESRDCGTGAGGFKPGNKCAGDDGDGGDDSEPDPTSPGTARDDEEGQSKTVQSGGGEIVVTDRSVTDAQTYLDEVEGDGKDRGLVTDFSDAKELQDHADLSDDEGALLAYTGDGYAYFTESVSGGGTDGDVIDSYGTEYGTIDSETERQLINEKVDELESEWDGVDKVDYYNDKWDSLTPDEQEEVKQEWIADRTQEIEEEYDQMRESAREDAIREMTKVLEAGTAASTLGCCMQLYRGLKLNDDAVDALLKDGYVSHSGVNSWTTSRRTAGSFSGGSEFNKGVVLVSRAPRVGYVNHRDSLDESEVIRPPSKMRITRAVKTSTKWFLYVDEDEDYKNA
jgi:HK97 family phage portal protein